MIVLIQSGNAVIDTDKIDKVITNKEGGIYATCGASGETLAKYDNLNIAKFVLKMYALDFAENEQFFEFPKNSDVMEIMQQHKTRNLQKFKGNSHGGS